MDTDDVQNGVQAAGQAPFLLQKGDEQIDAQGNPNLRLHGVARFTKTFLDAQVLFYHF